MSEQPVETPEDATAEVIEFPTVPTMLSPGDQFIGKAKQLVVDNYNLHHDSAKTPPLTIELVHVVWFTKTLDNWKAIVASMVARGLLYEVSYNGRRHEAYIDVYKKINNVKVSD